MGMALAGLHGTCHLIAGVSVADKALVGLDHFHSSGFFEYHSGIGLHFDSVGGAGAGNVHQFVHFFHFF